MMITLHGLPPSTKYQDIKILLKKECNIIDFILDNLMPDGDNSKKVRVGLADESEGYRLMKCLNGFRMSGTHVLKAVPVGKPGNVPQHNTYEARPGFSNQQRGNYPNQASNDYGNFGPQGPPGHVSTDAMGRPLPWSGSDPANQWVTNQPVRSPMQPNMNSSYGQQQPLHGQRPYLQGRGPQEQGYGYPPKNPEPRFEQPHGQVDSRSHVLRTVELADAAARYPSSNQPYPQQDKSMTIMKDNFQGPNQYNTVGHPGNEQQDHYQGQGQSYGQLPAWAQQGQQIKPQFAKPNPQYEKPSYGDRRSELDSRPDLKHSQPSMSMRATQEYDKGGHRFSPRRGSPSARPVSPHGRHISAPGRPISPGRHVSSSGRPMSPGRHISSSGRPDSPHGRHISMSGRAASPPGRHIPSSGRPGSPLRHISISGRPMPSSGRPGSPVRHNLPGRLGSPSGRHISPPARHISAPGRKFSPTRMHVPSGRLVPSSGRPISPGRRVSPPGRRTSPPVRRMSPPGRRASPGRREDTRRSPEDRRMVGRRESPRRYSPQKRTSPSRRLVSPPRQSMRISPSRHHPDKPADKYIDSEIAKNSKQVRPAYEPPQVQAPNQGIYSGGYRPNMHENLQYPKTDVRQGEQRMSPWQKDRDQAVYPTSMKKDDDRRDMTRMSNTRAVDRVLSEQILDTKKIHSPVRKSRSPIRRERSPIRDRYRRHSPSPRSPRRSWALEKRRSPEVGEAPPPPVWPGQSIRDDFPRHSRSNIPEKEDKKHGPVWDRSAFDDKDNERKRLEDEQRRPFGDKIRVRTDMVARDVGHAGDRFPPQNQRENHQPKFSPRDDFDQDRRSDYRRQDQPERKPYADREEKREFRDFPPRPVVECRQEEVPPRRQESPRRVEEKSDFRNIDKDFEDIYHRAVEFRKKAEELRRSGDRRKEEYSEDRSRHGEEVAKHYDQRQQLRREKSPPRHDTRSERNEGRSRPVENATKRDREPEWQAEDSTNRKFKLPPAIKVKREKAIEEISNKILDKHTEFQGDHRFRVAEEVRLAVSRILTEMFGNKDVSFIEIIIKYQARFNAEDEEKILQDVLKSMPKQYRNMKRKGPEPTEVPTKSSRRSPTDSSTQSNPRPSLSDPKIPEWKVNIAPPTVVNLPIVGIPQIATVMPPVMVPPPFASTFQEVPQEQIYVPPPEIAANYSNNPPKEEGYSLFLCQDDFEPFTEVQTEYLKKFIVQQIIRVTETSSWAPDITLKGLQSMYRYELVTMDESSKDWLINLDFSEFGYFNVLVYTKEELWYVRAAIWLPGHSRIRNIEPLEKLRLQNKKLHGVNIGKWKFVKKIVTMKGTRVYVDMPPSSARALEKHKMMLSYELQKVNVFLKAVAVDKDSFDAGLRECSLTAPAELAAAVQNSPMPSLNHEPGLIKISLNGSKSLTVEQARKIKEIIIYHLFKYHQQDGIFKTDFVKYGFCSPNYFGIVPQNAESKRWLMARHFGKLQRQAIIVSGGDDDNVRYFRMSTFLQNDYMISTSQVAEAMITEKLKQSNQGVKGINFNLWKPVRVDCDRKKARYEVDMDLDSVETLSKMKYQLDYVGDNNVTQTVIFRSEYSQTKFEEKIKKYRAEMSDSYDVANMDLDTSDSDDIICLD